MKKIILALVLAALLLVSCAPAAAPTAQPTTAATMPAAPASTTAPTQAEPAVTSTAAQPTEAALPVGGTLTRAISGEPPTLDPHGPAGAAQNAVLPYLFDTLVYRDLDNTYKPYLAESWTVSDDGKTITFVLREGVTFHDGTPLNAEAVVYTFQRLAEEGEKSPLLSSFANVEKIEAAGENEVVFSLKAPSASLFSTLSTAYAGILSPTAAEANAGTFGMNPVGSGPFKLETWQAGEAITLVRNEAYAWPPAVSQNAGAPRLEKLVFKVIPDASAQLTAFQTGEIDMLFVNQPSQIAALENDASAQMVETTLNSLIYLGFNLKAEPFDDQNVRLAVAHAIDKQELVELALGGVGEAVFSPLAPTLPGFDPALKSLEPAYDLAQTDALLQEAGFAKQADGTWTGADGAPLALELLTSTRPPNEALATILQDQLKRAGIPVEIRALESTAASEAATAGDYQMMLWRYDWNDADVLNVYLSTRRIGTTNRSNYSNPDLDSVLGKASQEMDDAKRSELYGQAQKILIAEQPWVPLYTPKDYIVMRSSLQGSILGPMGRIVLTDAYLQQ